MDTNSITVFICAVDMLSHSRRYTAYLTYNIDVYEAARFCHSEAEVLNFFFKSALANCTGGYLEGRLGTDAHR